MFKTYKPAGMRDPYGSYVHRIEAPTGSRLIYVSGQIPVRADGSTPEGIEAQAKVCWENIAAILKDAGVGLDPDQAILDLLDAWNVFGDHSQRWALPFIGDGA